MLKSCLAGAGSTGFTQSIPGNVLSNPEFSDRAIALFDIDACWLVPLEIIAQRIGQTRGLTGLRITATTNRRAEVEVENAPIEVETSNEYAVASNHGIMNGPDHLIYGNLRNNGLIDSLPAAAAVEVPCHAYRNGIQPVRVGSVLPHLACIMRSQINVQEMTVLAALTGKREHIYHAAMMDPHTAAELSLDEIRALGDTLIKAHGNNLPAYH